VQPEIGQTEIEEAPKYNLVWGPWATIGLGAAIFALYIVAQSLVAVIFIAIYALNSYMANPQWDFLPLIQRLTTDGLMISTATIVSGIVGAGFIILFIKIRKNISIREYLGLRPINLKTLLILLLVVVGLLAASFGLDQVMKGSQNTNFMVETYKTSVWLPLLWIAVVIFAPVFEEGFFRGFLFVGLKDSRIGATGTVALTSITWAALHLQYDWYGIVSILVLGIVLGIVRLRTGSLWSTLFLHALWNAIAMIQTALYINGIG
jgi:membrane protease YdiL (CAAX protease family)